MGIPTFSKYNLSSLSQAAEELASTSFFLVKLMGGLVGLVLATISTMTAAEPGVVSWPRFEPGEELADTEVEKTGSELQFAATDMTDLEE